jgi:hypothetical protein
LVSGGIVLQILVSIVSVLDLIHLKDERWQLLGKNVTVYSHLFLCCQACALYNNWWPMLSGEIKHNWNTIAVTAYLYIFIDGIVRWRTSSWLLLHSVFYSLAAITYVLLPMPLLFAGSDGSSIYSESDNR